MKESVKSRDVRELLCCGELLPAAAVCLKYINDEKKKGKIPSGNVKSSITREKNHWIKGEE